MLYALLITSRKLRHYFQSHKIKVVSSFPLGEILSSRDTVGCIIKWSVELGEFDLEFRSRQAIKSQILADFVSEWTETQQPPQAEKPEHWKMYFDGSLNLEGAGTGVLFISPQGDHLKYVLQIHYNASNNGAEYEALIHGLCITVSLGIKRLIAYGDSKVVIYQVNKACNIKKDSMNVYCAEVHKLADYFEGLEFHHVSHDNNVAADVLSKLGSKRARFRLACSFKTYASHRSDSSVTQRHHIATHQAAATSSWQRPKTTGTLTSSLTSWSNTSQKTRLSARRSSGTVPTTSSSALSCTGGSPPMAC
jgi:ribonuclease HI